MTMYIEYYKLYSQADRIIDTSNTIDALLIILTHITPVSLTILQFGFITLIYKELFNLCLLDT